MVNVFADGVNVKFRIDTGADVTVVPNHLLELLNGENIMPSSQILTGPQCETLNVQEKFIAKLKMQDYCSNQDICVVKNVTMFFMVYGEGVIGKSTARKWFAMLKNGNFDIDNMLHSRRPSEFDEDHLKALLKEESCQTSHELAKTINCDQKTNLNHLHSMGFAEKLGVWVPHELSENNKENRLQIASQHLIRH